MLGQVCGKLFVVHQLQILFGFRIACIQTFVAAKNWEQIPKKTLLSCKTVTSCLQVSIFSTISYVQIKFRRKLFVAPGLHVVAYFFSMQNHFGGPLIWVLLCAHNVLGSRHTNPCKYSDSNTAKLAQQTKFRHQFKPFMWSNSIMHSLSNCDLVSGRPMPVLHSQRVYTQLAITSVPQNPEQAKVNWGIWSKFFKTKHF